MKFFEDILLIVGLLLIIGTTFLINVYVGNYLMGIIFVLLAGFFAKTNNNKE